MRDVLLKQAKTEYRCSECDRIFYFPKIHQIQHHYKGKLCEGQIIEVKMVRLEVAEQLRKDANKLAEKYNELCDKFENEHGKNTNLEGRLKRIRQLIDVIPNFTIPFLNGDERALTEYVDKMIVWLECLKKEAFEGCLEKEVSE